MRSIVSFLVLQILSISYGVAQTASSSLDGEALYRKYACPICHGIKGNTAVRDGYPTLAGQNKTYLIKQITDIRDGIRDNGQSRLMRPLTLRIKRKEIEKISDYLARQ